MKNYNINRIYDDYNTIQNYNISIKFSEIP